MPVKAQAHGVQGEIRVFPEAVVVRAWYDTGEPMSYVRAEVWAPDSRVRFQIARTDRNGRLAFVPDRPGRWRVVLSDEMGHRLELSAPVTGSGGRDSPEERGLSTSRGLKALLGILLILGLFGWVKEIMLRVRRPK